MLSAIVAVDEDFGIGFNNQLLEHIPEDLKNFKQVTTGKYVVMGSKTFDSLPTKPLPDRVNIILTRKTKVSDSENIIYMDFDTFMTWYYYRGYTFDIFVIGGATIYKQLLPYCDKVYLTKIHNKHENIDAYFPDLDKTSEWTKTALSDIKTYKNISYQFWLYER